MVFVGNFEKIFDQILIFFIATKPETTAILKYVRCTSAF